MNDSRNLAVTMLSAGVLCLAVAGCGQTEPSAKTRADVSEARLDGAKDVAQERSAAAEGTIAAQKDVDQARTKLASESANANRDVAIAQAEAANKVAIEKCEAMTGEMRSSCKTQADHDLEQAKSNAEFAKVEADRKAQ
ncbi:hypothetical protein E4T66_08965 [Sinimarinibacterium sp. CAU 1509]|uniref:hypothetical protein n=1 Tax=Sinimarinibacterium sp. CAU 1509 TaxID=2562283 RepID=UPI0010ACD9BA|nr:hypothetical protein [Sinimarinibacterium sp. CAU 1509]TJY62332.1 hypothetical protein E4T66_08965 [Sinimarinibacterium sp. CAU 1509]